MNVAAVGVAVDRHGVAVDRHGVVVARHGVVVVALHGVVVVDRDGVVVVGLTVVRSLRIGLFWTCAIVVVRHDSLSTVIVNGKFVLVAR